MVARVSHPQVVAIVHVVIVVPIEDRWLVVQDCVKRVPIFDPASLEIRYLSKLVKWIGSLKRLDISQEDGCGREDKSEECSHCELSQRL